MRGEFASVLWDARRKEDAAKATASALEILEPAVDREAAVAYFLQQYAQFILAPSNQHPNPTAALKYALRADSLEHRTNPETSETLAAAYAATGDLTHAHDTARQALASMPAGGDADVREKLQVWLTSSKTPPR
jgi:hypothetical protein